MKRLYAILAVVVAALASPYAPSARSEDVRGVVEAANRALEAAIIRGDAQAVADLYTEDAQVIPPGGEVARGRAAVAAFWKKAIDGGIKDVRLKTDEVESAGDLACETGIGRIVDRDGGVVEGRYVVVWKRHNGKWKLHRDIWNSAGTEKSP